MQDLCRQRMSFQPLSRRTRTYLEKRTTTNQCLSASTVRIPASSPFQVGELYSAKQVVLKSSSAKPKLINALHPGQQIFEALPLLASASAAAVLYPHSSERGDSVAFLCTLRVHLVCWTFSAQKARYDRGVTYVSLREFIRLGGCEE